MTTAIATPRRVVVDWEEIKGQIELVNRIAADDLMSIWNAARRLPDLEARQYMFEALSVILETYGATAGDITADWWDSMMVDPTFLARPATAFNHEQMLAKIGWATSTIISKKADPFDRMAQLVQQAIFGAQRQTVITTAADHKLGYARVARPDACAFCRILASRGAVYGSKAAAEYVGAARWTKHYVDGKERGVRLKKGRIRANGVQVAGSKFHDHCRCTVAPAADFIDLNLPAQAERFGEEYDLAREKWESENGGYPNMSDLTKTMRALGFGA